MKRIRNVILAILIFGCFGIGFCLYQVNTSVNEMQLTGVDLDTIADGSYQGNCDAFLVTAEVEVNILNHQIQNIALLKHDNGLGKKGESVIDEMIRRNTTEVDTISSATISSTTIRCAVENALSK